MVVVFQLATVFALAQGIHFPFEKKDFQEIATIYANQTRLIPGERLLFKIENNLANGYRSFISKVVYVELINDTRQSVLKLKVELEDGIGRGHLYLPSYLKIGSYTLIAYTAWMMNYSHAFIAQLGIQIINPFNSVPSSFLSDSVGITFYPEGGTYLLDESNRVTYRLSFKKPLKKVYIKIISPAGALLKTVTHDHGSPYGHFDFTPMEIGFFKAIISDDDQNIFQGQLLVEANSSLGIAVSEKENAFELRALNRTGKPHVINIFPWRHPNLKSSILIGSDTTLTITKSKLPRGIVYAGYEGTNSGTFFSAGQLATEEGFKVSTDKARYNRRALVKLKFQGLENTVGTSLSVNKLYDQEFKSSYTSDILEQLVNECLETKELERDYLVSRFPLSTIIFDGTIVELPDYRGELFRGETGVSESSDHNNFIFLTSVSQFPVLKTAKVDDIGRFYLFSPGIYDDTDFVLSSFNQSNTVLKERFLDDHSFVGVDHFFDRTDITSWIGQKSIDVQIENNYSNFKRDVIVNTANPEIFSGRIGKTYDFDQYVRFSTIAEVIVEIIPELRLRERNGRVELLMPYIENKSSTLDSVLILLDGIPVRTKDFVRINPLHLKRVDLVLEQIRLGYVEYRGVAIFSSFGRDGSLLGNLPGYSKVDITPLQSAVEYYQPNYAGSKSTLPDHRNQLLWKTDLNFGEEINFYTSDLTGTFEIVLQGHDMQGNYMTTKGTLEVVK